MPEILDRPSYEQSIDRSIEQQIMNLDRLSSFDKIGIVLVAEGIKPAAILEMFHAAPDDPEDWRRDLFTLEKILDALHVPHALHMKDEDTPDSPMKDDFKSAGFYIGKDQKSLDRLLSSPTNKEVGLALGYPKTAVKAEQKHIAVPATTLAHTDHEKKLARFIYFKVDPNQAEQAFKIAQYYADATKRFAPNLYRDLTDYES